MVEFQVMRPVSEAHKNTRESRIVQQTLPVNSDEAHSIIPL